MGTGPASSVSALLEDDIEGVFDRHDSSSCSDPVDGVSELSMESDDMFELSKPILGAVLIFEIVSLGFKYPSLAT